MKLRWLELSREPANSVTVGANVPGGVLLYTNWSSTIVYVPGVQIVNGKTAEIGFELESTRDKAT